MANPLWAPWRFEYFTLQKSAGCIFCGVDGCSPQERTDRLILATTRRAFVLLNRYPYAAGHIMVAPHAHVASLDELPVADHDALFRLVRESATRIRHALRCQGLNIGLNLGEVAGAGIASHLHVHLVPRWAGDTNFMTVVADTRVIPQALEAARDALAPCFQDLAADVIDGEVP